MFIYTDQKQNVRWGLGYNTHFLCLLHDIKPFAHFPARRPKTIRWSRQSCKSRKLSPGSCYSAVTFTQPLKTFMNAFGNQLGAKSLLWFSGYLGQPQSCTYVNPSVAVPCSLVPVTQDWTKADFQWSTNPDGIRRSQGLLRKFGQLWLFGRCVQGMCLHNAHLGFFFFFFTLHSTFYRKLEARSVTFFFLYRSVWGQWEFFKSLKHSFIIDLC